MNATLFICSIFCFLNSFAFHNQSHLALNLKHSEHFHPKSKSKHKTKIEKDKIADRFFFEYGATRQTSLKNILHSLQSRPKMLHSNARALRSDRDFEMSIHLTEAKLSKKIGYVENDYSVLSNLLYLSWKCGFSVCFSGPCAIITEKPPPNLPVITLSCYELFPNGRSINGIPDLSKGETQFVEIMKAKGFSQIKLNASLIELNQIERHAVNNAAEEILFLLDNGFAVCYDGKRMKENGPMILYVPAQNGNQWVFNGTRFATNEKLMQALKSAGIERIRIRVHDKTFFDRMEEKLAFFKRNEIEVFECSVPRNWLYPEEAEIIHQIKAELKKNE